LLESFQNLARLPRHPRVCYEGFSALIAILFSFHCQAGEQIMSDPSFTVHRFSESPIITADLSTSIGTNIQGPSLIKVPDWIPNPLGKYYLYFADHKGSYIRLAYADLPTGPWKIYEPGSLQLSQSHFLTEPAEIPEKVQEELTLGGWAGGDVEGVPSPLESATKPHIASPDVHVREDRKEIVMYYHGLEGFRSQMTRVATSTDGIHFKAREEIIAYPYLRAFQHAGKWFGLSMPGVLYKSDNGLTDFESKFDGLFPRTMRHSALLLRDDILYVFWTRVGDNPEHVLVTTIDISGNWPDWRVTSETDVMFPEKDWEGADQPQVPSVRDAINVRVNQIRDPAIFEEDGRIYLLYAIAGEAGIAIAELEVHSTTGH
jgi:hypothetical protein